MTATKPTLVLLHGFLGSNSDWLSVTQCLSPHFNCVTPDLVLTDDMVKNNKQDDFLGFCRDLFLQLEAASDLPKQFSLLGYSMGGRIALAWAQLFPQRVTNLVLESCHPGLSTDPKGRADADRKTRLEQDLGWQKRFRKNPLDTALTDWYQQPIFSSLDSPQKKSLIRAKLAHLPVHFDRPLNYLSLARQPSFWTLDTQFHYPVYYICGQLDARFSEIGKQFSIQNPQLALYQFKDCGHNVHHEQTQEFCTLVLQLLIETK